MAAVVFDCDSTLAAVEGIDELAVNHRSAVEELTELAMSGTVPLEEVYGQRLELIRPGRGQLEELAARYVDGLVEDARETVAALHAAGVHVHIMSGGLRPAVLAVAEALGIPANRVGAVDIHFDDDGGYAGFDATSPLARAGGKRALLHQWREQIPTPVMMVGDGATDLEAADESDLFVAYAGVVERAAVVAAADVVIRSRSLAPVLPLALPDVALSGRHDRTWQKGLKLLGEPWKTALLQPREP